MCVCTCVCTYVSVYKHVPFIHRDSDEAPLCSVSAINPNLTCSDSVLRTQRLRWSLSACLLSQMTLDHKQTNNSQSHTRHVVNSSYSILPVKSYIQRMIWLTVCILLWSILNEFLWNMHASVSYTFPHITCHLSVCLVYIYKQERHPQVSLFHRIKACHQGWTCVHFQSSRIRQFVSSELYFCSFG